jgi:2-polyprenyl-3-methyl-5-hydroxy-6-metoxy-1,4-benzoquinol methylase
MERRNLDLEFEDNSERKYAYDIDTIVREHLLVRLEPSMRTQGNVLELGAYKGDMTSQLLDYFENVDVIEASPILSEEVRARFPGLVKVTTGLFEEVSPQELYDNIFLVHTLEHLDEPEAVLARISTWLKPDGRLFVAVPNANALSRQIAVYMGLISHNSAVTSGEFAHGHRRTYSLDTLLATVTAGGLKVQDFGGVVVKPLANFQFDLALEHGIVTREFISACDKLAKTMPDLSSSVYAICTL